MNFLSNAALVVIPKKDFFNWLIQSMEYAEIDTEGLEKSFDKIDVYTDCLVFLIPLFKDKEQFDNFIEKQYEEIFKNTLFKFIPDQRFWPKNLNLELFKQYFDVELHTRVANLSSK